MLPAPYLDAGHLAHGYAITAHTAQGMTASRAFVLGDEAMYREWGYVALSRGRESNRLYVVAPDVETVDDAGHRRIPAGLYEDTKLMHTTMALNDSHQHRMAIAEMERGGHPVPRAPLQAPPSLPPRDLGDAALRSELAAVWRRSCYDVKFPELAEPSVDDPGRSIAELSARQSRLGERRAALDAERDTDRGRLAATDGLIGRRRYGRERERLQAGEQRRSRELRDIDEEMAEAAVRLAGVGSDAVAVDAYHMSRESTARRWRELYDEGCTRIERRVQAAQASPTVVGHPPPPPQPSARSTWWSSAVEVERPLMWEDADHAAQLGQRRRMGEAAPAAAGEMVDAADILRSVQAAEAAARRRQRRAASGDDDAEEYTSLNAMIRLRPAQHEAVLDRPRLSH